MECGPHFFETNIGFYCWLNLLYVGQACVLELSVCAIGIEPGLFRTWRLARVCPCVESHIRKMFENQCGGHVGGKLSF